MWYKNSFLVGFTSVVWREYVSFTIMSIYLSKLFAILLTNSIH